MFSLLKIAWSQFAVPAFRRPKWQQVAALCYRENRGRREFLLITSRDSKRWIIPKGWPIRGLRSHEAALQEAWEEAGVKDGETNEQLEGVYHYQKRQLSGWSFPVETLVFSIAVTEISDVYPEVSDRTRKWVSANEAATMVEEPGLQNIFRALADQVSQSSD